MKVAVIGAGLSGLACAHELERHGICPDIFESNRRVGLDIPMVHVLLQIFERRCSDQLQYLSKEFRIKIRPLDKIRKVVIQTPWRTVQACADHGYLVERGQGEESAEVQLSRQVNASVKFNTRADFRGLSGSYDYVVVADGSPSAAIRLGTWETTVSSWVKGAIILGRFEPGVVRFYLNTGYARHGYGYLAPFDRERAMVMLCVPGIDHHELNSCWDKFIDMNMGNMNLEIIETFDTFYSSGICTRHQVDNILLAGNSGGFTDSFLGLGIFAGVASGALAGRSIAKGLDYEKMVAFFKTQVRLRQVLREAFNTLDNRGIDKFVRTITFPGIRQAIYKTNIDFIGMLTPLAKMRLKKPFPSLPPRKKNNLYKKDYQTRDKLS